MSSRDGEGVLKLSTDIKADIHPSTATDNLFENIPPPAGKRAKSTKADKPSPLRTLLPRTAKRERAAETSPLSPSPCSPPFAVKRARKSKASEQVEKLSLREENQEKSPRDVATLTPLSTPTVNSSIKLSDHVVSPLSSSQRPEGDFQNSEKSPATLPETPISAKARQELGLTNLTIAEGDRRSQPQPGPALLQLVEEAKGRFIAKIYDSSVIRLIDGEWMAPQKCSSCDATRNYGCDRGSPCSVCLKGKKTCQNGGMMTKLKTTRAKGGSHEQTHAALVASEQTHWPLMHSSLMQDSDGTWSLNATGIAKQSDSPVKPSSQPVASELRTPNKRSPASGLQTFRTSIAKPQSSQALSRVAQTKDFLKVVPPPSAYLVMAAPETTSCLPIIQAHVYQNSDGIWSLDTCITIQSFNALVKTSSEPEEAGPITYVDFSAPIGISEFHKAVSKPQISRASKRKVSDKDFVYHNADDSEDALIPPRKSVKRSKLIREGKVAVAKVTKDVYHANNQMDKPEPHGSPKVWANKRQQLCETLPYYLSYQGGAYTSDGIAYGSLIDAEFDVRDRFDEQTIITSVGGGRTKDDKGKATRSVDQVESSTALAYIRSREAGIPIGVIAGQGNRLSSSRLPHYYNVLDWFHVTDVWPERIGGFIAWKVRLDKVNLAEKSWWAVKGSPDIIIDKTQTVESRVCPQCSLSSKTLYNAGWTCLKATCDLYFQFPNDYEESSLDYSQAFLQERSIYPGKQPGPLSKPLLTATDMAQMDVFGVECAFKKGIVCPKCGCCSRRIHWDHWKCENVPNCDFTYYLKQKPMSIHDVLAKTTREEKAEYTSSPKKQQMKKTKLPAGMIPSSLTTCGHWDIIQYEIPGEVGENIGFVRHFKANGIINQQKDGPNDLFMQMQGGNCNLTRNAARLKGSTGEVLTSHWASNWGAPYKFGVKQISKGFNEAPSAILKAIKRLTWAGTQAMSGSAEPFQAFNECLSIGYFEETHIGYHDDGEKELGPTIATLSLGASANMKFRPKAKSSIGEPLPALGEGPPKKKKDEGRKLKPPILSIELEHGDMIIMHGRKIQELYEHAVTPHGPLRYALTCRYIRPEMMINEEEARDAILRGTLPPGSEIYDYDGDFNAVPAVQTISELDRQVKDVAARLKTGNMSEDDVRKFIEQLSTMIEPKSVIESAGDANTGDVF